jgi:hypothetical protein
VTEDTIPSEAVRPKRPVGVWILTIYLAIFAGMAPLSLLAFLFVAERGAEQPLLGPSSVISIVTGLGTIISAIAAWRGKNWGRYALVGFAALHYGLVSAKNYVLLQADDLPDVASLDPMRLWGRVLRGPIYVAIVGWYFLLSKGAKGFYDRPAVGR